MKKIFYIGALLALSTSNYALAYNDAGRGYVELEGSYMHTFSGKYAVKDFTPVNVTSSTPTEGEKMDTLEIAQRDDEGAKGMAAFLELGYHVTDEMKVGVQGFYLANVEGKLQDVDALTPGKEATVKYKGFGGFLQLSYGQSFGSFSPYITAGIGASYGDITPSEYVEYVVKDGAGGGKDGAFEWKEVEESKTRLAWNVGVGGEYRINDLCGIKASYKFMDAGLGRDVPAFDAATDGAYGKSENPLKAPYLHSFNVGIAIHI